mmetsp:Transcript_8622/g.32086  ORF Transcript_8622/g.32086 Transcript_8622/m.32086 type:complete len:283 (-) Transcript_8622:486-1334(-)
MGKDGRRRHQQRRRRRRKRQRRLVEQAQEGEEVMPMIMYSTIGGCGTIHRYNCRMGANINHVLFSKARAATRCCYFYDYFGDFRDSCNESRRRASARAKASRSRNFSNPGCERKILAYSAVATTADAAVAYSNATRVLLSVANSSAGAINSGALCAAITGSHTAAAMSAICIAVFTLPMNSGRNAPRLEPSCSTSSKSKSNPASAAAPVGLGRATGTSSNPKNSPIVVHVQFNAPARRHAPPTTCIASRLTNNATSHTGRAPSSASAVPTHPTNTLSAMGSR